MFRNYLRGVKSTDAYILSEEDMKFTSYNKLGKIPMFVVMDTEAKLIRRILGVDDEQEVDKDKLLEYIEKHKNHSCTVYVWLEYEEFYQFLPPSNVGMDGFYYFITDDTLRVSKMLDYWIR